MESSSNSANSSFGSTASSTSGSPPPPQAPHKSEATAADDRGVTVIKQEPTTDADAYDSSEWAHIFDENGVVCLDVDDDDDPMDAADIAADPRRREGAAGGSAGAGAHPIHRDPETALHEPTPSSALLENWGYYDTDMLSQSHDVDGVLEPSTTAFFSPETSRPLASGQNAKPTGTRPAADRPTNMVSAAPMHTVVFETQSHGQPFPLSKPLLRDDGLVVVGTELALDGSVAMTNRIFISRVGARQEPLAPQMIKTSADVRDLEWLSRSAAVAAIGSDIHLLLLSANGSERGDLGALTAPIRRMHADTIRELAVLTYGRDQPAIIASGGFDETVVLTKLGEGGDPAAAKMDSKIDACDVVSSLRWHPTETVMLSWTTDGGDFQIADVRARTKPQLQVALSSFLQIDHMGGLFSHEYISPSNIVLGFQSGQLLFLDLRMPRKQYCYGVMHAPLASVGEMRRSAMGKCAMFGVGGFAMATVNSVGRELASLVGMRPSQSTHVGFQKYKTSGDFSHESGSFYAVSDSLGVVSVYAADPLSVATDAKTASGSASDSDWQSRAV